MHKVFIMINPTCAQNNNNFLSKLIYCLICVTCLLCVQMNNIYCENVHNVIYDERLHLPKHECVLWFCVCFV